MMTGFRIPPQLIVFLVITLVVGGTIEVAVVDGVESALITGKIDEETDIQKADMYYHDDYFYTKGKNKIPIEKNGNLLYDLFIGKGSQSDTFEIFINASKNEITSLKVAEYIPRDDVNLAYTTLLLALRIYCPAGATVIQFIQIIDWGYDVQFYPLGNEMNDTFPEVKECPSVYNNSEGNIVNEAINWITNQIYPIIDKGIAHSVVNCKWPIGMVFGGLVAFTRFNPLKG